MVNFDIKDLLFTSSAANFKTAVNGVFSGTLNLKISMIKLSKYERKYLHFIR